MHGLTAREIVDVWDAGQDRSRVEQAQVLLEAALPHASGEDLAALRIGTRDRHLLELRAKTFGPLITAYTECPVCGESYEFSVATDDLEVPEPPVAPGEFELSWRRIRLRCRLPNSVDLELAAQADDLDAARMVLAARCVVEALRDGAVLSTSDLPRAAIDHISDRMAQLDPQAEVTLDLACQSCGASWSASFDIATFLWDELSVRARRLLREVNALARAFGWSERDVLSMSWRRRHAYLELIAG